MRASAVKAAALLQWIRETRAECVLKEAAHLARALPQLCSIYPGSGLAADISLGAANGVRAVVYVQRQLAAMPQLRPLVLVVKAFLRQNNLNEARISLTSVCSR